MNDNEVSLYIGGSIYKNWTSFSITNELNTICTAYSQNIIEYGNHKFEYSENCPKWNGFGILKRRLKLK